MAWQVSGRSLDLCSRKMWCPCWLGPDIEPDEGWCAHTFGFDIRRGNSDGVNLSGTIVAFTGEWPANFFLGRGKARLYIGETATEDQQRELAISAQEKRSFAKSLGHSDRRMVANQGCECRNCLGRETDPVGDWHWPSDYAAIIKRCWESDDCIWRDVASRTSD